MQGDTFAVLGYGRDSADCPRGATTKTHLVTGSRVGTLALVVAAVFVGLAIAADGAPARALNGTGGVLWIGAAGVIAWSLRNADRRRVGVLITVACAFVLAVFVRPSDAILAMVGFATAGVLTALVVRINSSLWARLIPAIWLPAHLVVAIGGVIGRDLAGAEPLFRAEPPPTAAAVPLLMVLASWGGAEIIVRTRERRARSSRHRISEQKSNSRRGSSPGRGKGAL